MLRTKIHFVLSLIGTVLGISAFICFCYIYPNIEAGIWGLFSGLNAFIAMLLHYHELKETLHVNFSRRALKYIGDAGMVAFVSGCALTLFYLFLELYYAKSILPVESSIIIRLVWSFMMLKWGLRLYYVSEQYIRTYNDEQLFTENPRIEET